MMGSEVEFEFLAVLKRPGARGTERIKKASHLQRLIFHFQPNLQSTGKHACSENAKEGEKNLEVVRSQRGKQQYSKREDEEQETIQIFAVFTEENKGRASVPTGS
uniref:Uncharacterized protein n=1 Tax=Maylandia zebra TaxID=106582 RepID=A0A3P9B4C6_9CICH